MPADPTISSGERYNMEIQRIAAITPVVAGGSPAPSSSVGGDLGRAFGDLIGKLAETENATGDLVARAAGGENVDLHDVMIATQAESLAFQVALQVRNK